MSDLETINQELERIGIPIDHLNANYFRYGFNYCKSIMEANFLSRYKNPIGINDKNGNPIFAGDSLILQFDTIILSGIAKFSEQDQDWEIYKDEGNHVSIKYNQRLISKVESNTPNPPVIPLLLLITLLSSCDTKAVIVWTISDIVGLVVLSLLFLIIIVSASICWVKDRLKRSKRNKCSLK